MFELVERYISTFLLSHKMALRKKKEFYLVHPIMLHLDTLPKDTKKKQKKTNWLMDRAWRVNC